MSIWHWLVVGAVALLLFGGKGKISELMGDVAKGIKSFKKGMQEDEKAAEATPPAEPPKTIDQTAATTQAQPSAATTQAQPSAATTQAEPSAATTAAQTQKAG
jgi:sec-independent protein translocase protein TatA